MVHFKHRDLQPAFVEHHALTDILREDHDAVGRCPVVVQPDADVELIRLLEVRHHLLRSPRAPDVERTIASRADEPARQPEIRKPDHVIRVQVREEDTVHVLPADFELGEALQRPTARVEEELLAPGFHESAGPESIHDGRRSPGAEKGDPDLLPGGSGWDKSHESENNANCCAEDARDHATLLRLEPNH